MPSVAFPERLNFLILDLRVTRLRPTGKNISDIYDGAALSKRFEHLRSSALLKPFFSRECVHRFKFVFSYMCSVTQIQTESDTFISSYLNFFLVNRLFNIGNQALHAKPGGG